MSSQQLPRRTPRSSSTRTLDFLAGGGDMGARMRALDWTRTPLGAPDGWPQSLKTIVRVMLDSRYAMWMLWGPELTFFCNDAYLPTVGLKRDWVLGARADVVWEEIWPDIGPRIQQVLTHGQATWDEALLLFLERSGFVEETYHTFSYSLVYDDENRIAGMLCVVTEVTERVIGERQLQTLRDLGTRASGAESVQQAAEWLVRGLAGDRRDVPFALLYIFLAMLAHELRNPLAPASSTAKASGLASWTARKRSSLRRSFSAASRRKRASASTLSTRASSSRAVNGLTRYSSPRPMTVASSPARAERKAVYDAREALERITAFNPQAVLLDIGLPGMDGYEVARRMRQLPHGRGVKLIALTDYGQAEDRARVLQAGFDDHLVKPVDLSELNRCLADLDAAAVRR